MPIRTILFDFGGVIWTPLDPSAVKVNRRRLAAKLGFDNATAMWLHFYRGDEWRKAKTGQWTNDQMWEALLTPFGMESPESRNAFLNELFQGVGLKPSMDGLLRQLRSTYSLSILSNASDILEWRLNKLLKIDSYFDVVINSHRIQVAKPHPEAFQIALELMQVRPEEVFFIDDQLRNTRVAEKLGIKSHVFKGVLSLKKDLQRQNILPDRKQAE